MPRRGINNLIVDRWVSKSWELIARYVRISRSILCSMKLFLFTDDFPDAYSIDDSLHQSVHRSKSALKLQISRERLHWEKHFPLRGQEFRECQGYQHDDVWTMWVIADELYLETFRLYQNQFLNEQIVVTGRELWKKFEEQYIRSLFLFLSPIFHMT